MQRSFVWLAVLLLVLTACATQVSATPPKPPPFPAQEVIEFNLSNPPWWWTDAQYVYAFQVYCAYTVECDTKHIWLGETWGYGFPSYSTVVYGNTITVADLYVVHVRETCFAGETRVATSRNITAQGVMHANGDEIRYFCVEDLR